jgi:hypothetical protein
MFVTSDIFDLEAIGRFKDFKWRENLFGAVGVHGTAWRGYKVGASFLLAAARQCGLLSEMMHASYARPGERRQLFIKPTSFERLVRGELRGAQQANTLLLQGERDAEGTEYGRIYFGGIASAKERSLSGMGRPFPVADYPYRAFDADFCFPFDEAPRETASALLRLAVNLLDAEYGYYFVRDYLAGPNLYCWGAPVMLDGGDLSDADKREIDDWYVYMKSGRLWTDGFPLFRDLFEVNLISERHTSVRVEALGGSIIDWIEAAPNRGRIEPLGRGRRLWTLSDQEMFDVRPVLDQAGLLTSCRPRIYRDLHPGTGVTPYAAPWCYNHVPPWEKKPLEDP